MHEPKGRADQARGLRQITGPTPVKVLAVTGGKGGVGKTSMAINLGVELSRLGREVLLLDADLGMANVDVLLGLQPRYTLSHVLSGECGLEDIIIDGPAGLHVVPAASGRRRMADLGPAEHAGLIGAFSELARALDVLIVDTAAGISGSVVNFTQAAQQVVVVVCDDPASITDAYALMKVLSADHDVRDFHILTNMTADRDEGRALFGKIARAAERFLDLRLQHLGNVPLDPYLRRSVQEQIPLGLAYPSASAALALRDIAERVDAWQPAGGSRGRLEFFAERLIRTDTPMVANA